MKKILTVLAFLLISNVILSQNKDVEIIQETIEETIKISFKNNTQETKEIELTLNATGFENFKTPVTKEVAPSQIVHFITLKTKQGISWSLSSTYKYISKPTNEEVTLKKQRLESKVLKNVGDISKGIVVFSKDGCTRCAFATSYLVDNDIDFKMLNITENEEYNKLMWQKLRENGTANNVTMPVILVNGKISHSHKDLQSYITTLKKQNKTN